MCRVIKRIPVVGKQAMEKAKAQKKLNSYAEELAMHMAKCVVYGDSIKCLKHWLCEEISDWISRAAVVKHKGGKMKPELYKRTLFGYLGDDKNDALGNLKDLQIAVKRHKYDYPYFNITQSMVDNMYTFSKNMSDKISLFLANNKGNEVNDRQLQKMLMDIYIESIN